MFFRFPSCPTVIFPGERRNIWTGFVNEVQELYSCRASAQMRSIGEEACAADGVFCQLAEIADA